MKQEKLTYDQLYEIIKNHLGMKVKVQENILHTAKKGWAGINLRNTIRKSNELQGVIRTVKFHDEVEEAVQIEFDSTPKKWFVHYKDIILIPPKTKNIKKQYFDPKELVV